MKYRPDESTLVSYLYGELSEKEKEKIDTFFRENPDELRQLQQLSGVREIMGKASDKEVIAPPIFMDDQPVKQLWMTTSVKTIVGIAASILLVVVAARLMVTEISYSAGELKISFGSQQAKPQVESVKNELSASDVQKMIDASLGKNEQAMNVKFAENQKKLNTSIRRNLDTNSKQIDELMSRASQASQLQVRAFVASLQEENLQSMRDYLQLSSTEQKRYTENLLVDFSKWLQEQRNQDLITFQTRMNSIEQNTGLFQQETEQILASIISVGGLEKSR